VTLPTPIPSGNAVSIPDIGSGWLPHLAAEFERPYFRELKAFLMAEREQHSVFPKGSDIFHAFKRTPFDNVRVVIIGQDPYHGPGQAHGLSFSVPPGVRPPPSLQNIFTELKRDLGIPAPSHGDLGRWADQGVLLLNATLTVRAEQAGSHQGKGWERFTDAAISALARERTGLIFLLWGRYAQAKEELIGTDRHYILKAPHPSPLSAHRGFIGCGHFGQVNELLAAQGQPPIDWNP
jgi:uracil-DNA glycosylase